MFIVIEGDANDELLFNERKADQVTNFKLLAEGLSGYMRTFNCTLPEGFDLTTILMIGGITNKNNTLVNKDTSFMVFKLHKVRTPNPIIFISHHPESIDDSMEAIFEFISDQEDINEEYYSVSPRYKGWDPIYDFAITMRYGLQVSMAVGLVLKHDELKASVVCFKELKDPMLALVPRPKREH